MSPISVFFYKTIGVERNPTEDIINSLKEDKEWALILKKLNNYELKTAVLICSIDSVDSFFEKIDNKNEIKEENEDEINENETVENRIVVNNISNEKQEIIFIHLGVDANGSGIKLESKCYNNKTFRIPDQSGNKPENECISVIDPLDLPLHSNLDILQIYEKIVSENYDFKVEISVDPGRYLCNYIYYKSLKLCNDGNKTNLINEINESNETIQTIKNTTNTNNNNSNNSNNGKDSHTNSKDIYKSIFIHFPPANVISLEDQIKFIKNTIETIAQI